MTEDLLLADATETIVKHSFDWLQTLPFIGAAFIITLLVLVALVVALFMQLFKYLPALIQSMQNLSEKINGIKTGIDQGKDSYANMQTTHSMEHQNIVSLNKEQFKYVTGSLDALEESTHALTTQMAVYNARLEDHQKWLSGVRSSIDNMENANNESRERSRARTTAIEEDIKILKKSMEDMPAKIDKIINKTTKSK